MVTIAINGFGRIGRYLTRLIALREDIIISVINARADNATLAHLLQYDSSQGKYHAHVDFDSNGLYINRKYIPVTHYPLTALDWKTYPSDLVVETTGTVKARVDAQKYIDAGARRLVVSSPLKDGDATFVYGVNHITYNPEKHYIISSASCTTNCLAPVAKVIHEKFGIAYGSMTTVHAYTMSQRLLDGTEKDLRRARAAALSIIPTSTGAAKAIGLVLPELEGKLHGMAMRVPVATGSIIDFVCMVHGRTNKEEVNAVFEEASQQGLYGVLGFTTLPLVSCDYIGTTYASIIDGLCTDVIEGSLLKVLAWYDNEASFTNQLLRLLLYIVQSSNV